MNCKDVQEILDLASDNPSVRDTPELQNHLGSCPDCRQAVEKHQAILATLARIVPGTTSREQFIQKVAGALKAHTEKRKESPEAVFSGTPSASFPKRESGRNGWAEPWKYLGTGFPRLAFASLACISIVLGLMCGWYSSRSDHQVPQQVESSPPLIGSLKIDDQQMTRVKPGEPVTFAPESRAVFSPLGGGVVNIIGSGSGTLDQACIHLHRPWQGTLEFSPQPHRFRVKLPTVVLGIRGTVLHICQNEAFGDVSLEKGSVDWENLGTKERGLMKPGDRLRFFPNETVVLAPQSSTTSSSPSAADQSNVTNPSASSALFIPGGFPRPAPDQDASGSDTNGNGNDSSSAEPTGLGGLSDAF